MSTSITRVDPPELGAPVPSFHQVNVVNGLVFLAGQAAQDENDRIVGEGDTYRQTLYALERARIALESVGSDLEHVLTSQVFLTDEADFDGYNRAWKEVFGQIRPGRATVRAELVVPGCHVEIILTACVKQ